MVTLIAQVAKSRIFTRFRKMDLASCCEWVSCILEKCEKKFMLDYRQSTSLTIAPWLPMKKGSRGVCNLLSETEPIENKGKKVRRQETEKQKNSISFFKNHNLDTRKWLPIYTLSFKTLGLLMDSWAFGFFVNAFSVITFASPINRLAHSEPCIFHVMLICKVLIP